MEKMKKRKAIGAFVKGAAYSLTALLAFSCGNSQQGGMPALSLAVTIKRYFNSFTAKYILLFH